MMHSLFYISRYFETFLQNTFYAPCRGGIMKSFLLCMNEYMNMREIVNDFQLSVKVCTPEFRF